MQLNLTNLLKTEALARSCLPECCLVSAFNWDVKGEVLWEIFTSLFSYIWALCLEFLIVCITSNWVNQIKIKITFIVTSPQHKCLGEWNSYERAPDSAKKQQTIYLWTDSAKKQQTVYLWTDSAKKQQTIYLWTDSAKKQQTVYLWTDSAKKQQTIYIWTDSAKKLHWSIYSAPDSAKKNNSNLHMDRQCKKQQQFTYGQYIFTDCTEDNVQNTHTYTQYA